MADLKLFAGIHQALGRMCLLDGRPRREIAAAAGINPSMLSGYCSGRLMPSLEHLDRLLVALHRRPEDLVGELRAVSETQQARATTQVAVAALEKVLAEVRHLVISEMNNLQGANGSAQLGPAAQLREAADSLRPQPARKAGGGRKGRKSPQRKEP